MTRTVLICLAVVSATMVLAAPEPSALGETVKFSLLVDKVMHPAAGATSAQWIVERYPTDEVGRPDADGWVEARLPVASRRWFVRTMLRLGPGARIVEPDRDPALIERLRTMGEKTYTGHVERAIVVELVASDANCSKHITPRWTREYVDELTGLYRRDIEQLQAQIDDLRGHDHTG